MKRTKTVITTAVAAFAAVALSGCIELSMDLTLSPDAEISGTSFVAFNKTELNEAGVPIEQAVGYLTEQINIDDLPAGATVEEIDDDTHLGFQMNYDGVAASLMAQDESASMQFSYTESEIVFVSVNLIAQQKEFGDPEAADDMLAGIVNPEDLYTSATLAITFPGKVLEAEGATISGNRVEWNMHDYDGEYLIARAENPNGIIPPGLEGDPSGAITLPDPIDGLEPENGDEPGDVSGGVAAPSLPGATDATPDQATSGVQAPALPEEITGLGTGAILAIIAGVALVALVGVGVAMSKKSKANAPAGADSQLYAQPYPPQHPTQPQQPDSTQFPDSPQP